MNICLNYYGQPRGCKKLKENYLNNIKDDINTFHCVYTTWNTEDISEFKNIFPDSFINQIEKPNISYFSYFKDNYTMDHTWVSNNVPMDNFLYFLYIKTNSIKTIEKYEEINNIKFDIVITLRPDHYFTGTNINYYYNVFEKSLTNSR